MNRQQSTTAKKIRMLRLRTSRLWKIVSGSGSWVLLLCYINAQSSHDFSPIHQHHRFRLQRELPFGLAVHRRLIAARTRIILSEIFCDQSGALGGQAGITNKTSDLRLGIPTHRLFAKEIRKSHPIPGLETAGIM